MADTVSYFGADNKSKLFSLIYKNSIQVFFIIPMVMLIIPMPAILLDFFMALNLAFAVVIFLIVLYTPKSSNFTSFPRVILFLTLFGLGVNVSSTRLILTKGIDFDGQMVRTFSKFVVGNSDKVTGLVVGFVIFIILIVIQVLVITKGATRVSEVAARFALDSMAQKNFAVDAELNNGSITEAEATQKRAEIRRESDFFSAMDGSSKFVSGNVTAGIVITVVNLLAGMAIGVFYRGEPAIEAAKQYCSLTIGDGLLSQIPSMLLSFATGLIVTGNSSDQIVSENIKQDFSISGWVYAIGGGFIAILGVLPGMPWYILIPMGFISIFVGSKMLKSEQKEKEKKELESSQKQSGKSASNSSDTAALAKLPDLCLELGYALIPLVDNANGAELLERITRIRRESATDLGLIVPPINIIDNMTLDPSEYSFKIKGIEMGRSKLKLGFYMCIDNGLVTEKIEGEKTKDPTFNMDAVWVPESRRADAEQAGYMVADPPTVIATHLTELIRNNAADILGKKEVKLILDKTKETNSIVVDEVLDTAKFNYGQIEKVLQNLLREKVSIRNIERILDTMAGCQISGPVDLWFITERVRKALGLQICLQYADEDRRLRVFNLGQDFVELFMNKGVYPSDGSKPYAAFDPVDFKNWLNKVSNALQKSFALNDQFIILAPEEVRLFVKHSLENQIPSVIVISHDEVAAAGNKIQLEVLGEISMSGEGGM